VTAHDQTGEVGLGDLCTVVRTKNAGPYLFALDLMFRDRDVYAAVRDQQLITRSTVAAAYHVTNAQVTNLEYYDEVYAVKAVLRRPFVAGSPGDPDCYSMNQEVPALEIRLPVRLLPGVG
jgi:hypothetical protein